ncbi:conserved membrane hypothetical protein [uncultured Paludibacter sp.]|nr:conserved membrane hypothetical protein [uncultured Paludibacter sp.]
MSKIKKINKRTPQLSIINNLATFAQQYWRSIFISLIIFFLSVYNFSSIQGIPKFKYSDKIVHLCLYFILTFTLFYEYKRSLQLKSKIYHLLILILFPVIYGGLIEIIQQSFFPPRTAEWLDWCADITGTLFGGIMAFLFLKK